MQSYASKCHAVIKIQLSSCKFIEGACLKMLNRRAWNIRKVVSPIDTGPGLFNAERNQSCVAPRPSDVHFFTDQGVVRNSRTG